jgi:hypothetical protein
MDSLAPQSLHRLGFGGILCMSTSCVGPLCLGRGGGFFVSADKSADENG